MNTQSWAIARQFLANITTYFTIGNGRPQTRVGCIQFGSTALTVIDIYSKGATNQNGLYSTLTTMSQLGNYFNFIN